MALSILATLIAPLIFLTVGPVDAAAIDRRAPSGIPQFALDYAPLIYLHSDDPYRPSDIGAQLANTDPKVNFNPIAGVPNPLTLDNLNQLNNLGGTSVYLTGKQDVARDTEQAWLKGVNPDGAGKTNGAVTATIVVNQKDATTTDVFYFYFYAYNSGPPVLGIKFGDHVGDWEYIMVRFNNEVPSALWYSQHADGEAFSYAAVRKNGKRPIGYSAKGSHANYALDGKHDHTIPGFTLPGSFFLVDDTNAGVLWDPLLSAYYYSFNAGSNTFTPYDPTTPVNWLYFNGKWGDQQYQNSHINQYVIFGQARFSNGPTGPLDKQLQRNNVCPNNIKCIIRPFITARKE